MLARADALLGEGAGGHADFALHTTLGRDLGGGGGSQPLFRRQEPGSCARPIRRAWRPCSTSRPRCCGSVGILLQPVDARRGMASCSTCSASPPESAHFAAARRGRRHARAGRRALPAPAPIFPRYVEPEAAKAAEKPSRLHAHRQPLPSRFPRFRRRARRGRRARPRGRRRAHDHDLDPGREVRAASRASPSATTTSSARSARIRTRRAGGAGRSIAEPASSSRAIPRCVGDRRGGPRLSLRPQPARRRQARVFRAHIARRARDGPAARHPRPRRRRGHRRRSCARKWGRGPSAPCSIVSPASRELAETGLELGSTCRSPAS